jgi:hypothetical protein
MILEENKHLKNELGNMKKEKEDLEHKSNELLSKIRQNESSMSK